MNNKTVLITGGNAGIGKYTAIGIAKKGHKVIIVSRDATKGAAAVKEIINESKNDDVHFLQADLASFGSVRQLATDFIQKFQSLDILINNAGAFFSTYEETEDGFERQWQINHLSGFLLTHLLLDIIKKSPQGRIINVSSKGHYKGFLFFKDLNRSKNYNGLAAYAQSKLANVVFTKMLSEKLNGTHVTVNALHPGVVKTSIGDKNNSSWIGLAWKVGKLFMITEAQGARTSIFLALDQSIANVSGKYFDNCQMREPNPYVNDPAIAQKLWDISSEQVGLLTK